MNQSQKIKERAKELGFELAGIVPAKPVPDFDFFRWWLDQGYGATMAYLSRGAERRGNPEKILPGVKSVICCALNYYTEHPSGPVSNYAWGEDYHRVIGQRLEELRNFIHSLVPGTESRNYVDTGPVLERSYAAQAGLGWIGKNTCLINNGLGSFVFLGEILTTLELPETEYDRPLLDQCGTCTLCLDACPTNALPEPYVLDANRCISYLTIEYRGDFTEEQKKEVKGHVYGCDICQTVCPYNDRIPVTPLKEFQPRPSLAAKTGQDLETITEEEFGKIRSDSPMERIRWEQWQRNVRSLGKG